MFALLVLFILPAVRPEDCTSFSFQCSDDCKSLGYCTPSSSGGYQWKETVSCGAQFCDPNSQQCSPDQTACKSTDTEVNILCGTDGDYPDPYECHKYYSCTTGRAEDTPPTMQECTSNYGYNACTKTCDIPLTNGQCNSTGTVCSKAGEIHLVATNHQLFYVCSGKSQEELKPVMMKCVDHEVFDLKLQTCVPRTGAGCSSDGGETSCSVTCTSSGLVADPCNCRGYYFCRPDLTPIAFNCTAGYHYVANTGCFAGDCTN